MTTIVKIDGEAIGVAEFIADLEADRAVRGAHRAARQGPASRCVAAKKQGVAVSPTKRSRSVPTSSAACAACTGRPTPTSTSTRMGVSLDEFEAFITDGLYQEKMMEQVCSDEAVRGVLQAELAHASTASR